MAAYEKHIWNEAIVASEITCVTLDQNRRITALGGTDRNGQRWFLTLDALLEAMQNGVRYYVRTPADALMVWITRDQQGHPALTIGLDEGTHRLYSLPRCRESAPLNIRRLRVLIVDDHPDAAASLAKFVEILGHEARFVITPESALPAATDFRPDVVFLDLNMPAMTGFEVAMALRQHFSHEEPRIVAITGHESPELRARGRKAGLDAYIHKPADLDVVERILLVLTTDPRARI